MTSQKKQRQILGRPKNEKWGGQQGNKRGKPDVQVARRRNREQDGRWREATAAATAEREALEARLAREAVEPAVGPVAGALWVKEHPPEPEPAPVVILPRQRRRRPFPVPADATGKPGWSMGQARSMLRHGYHVIYVMELTGWGLNALDDLPIDCDGYGLPVD